MRPYLAIISDSFRAAFASRVLWIVLAAIVLFLCALAPIGYQEVYTVEFSRRDVNSYQRLVGRLASGLQTEETTPAGQVAAALDEELQTAIRQAAEEEGDGPERGQLIDAINELTEDDQWYDETVWEGTLQLSELRELNQLGADELDPTLRRRRARLRIEAALPGVFRPQPTRSLQLTYAWLTTPVEIPMRRERFAELLNQTAIPLILNFMLGVGAVFVGILVTSPIIPEMFQPGSLHLLLSKPISRPALYLSKFIGGCAFVLLCVSLLVSGMFVITGWRLDMWNGRLLLTIPVFVFLFAVYYSVSALAGLHWRSAVVSVVVTVLFWFCCFLVGQAGGLADGVIKTPNRVAELTQFRDGVLLSTELGGLKYAGGDPSGYRVLLEASSLFDPQRVIGPATLPDGRIAVARVSAQSMGRFGATAKLMLFDPANDWAMQEGIELPRGTQQILHSPQHGLLALAANGLFRADADGLEVAEETIEAPQSGGFLSGMQRLLGREQGPFELISPDTLGIFNPAAIALVPDSGDVIVYSAGTVYRLTPGEPGAVLQTAATQLLEGDNSGPSAVAVVDNRVVIARKAEPLVALDLATLAPRADEPFDTSRTITSLHALPRGRTLLGTTSDRRVVRLTLEEERLEVAPAGLPHGRNTHGLTVGEQGRVWLAHDIDFLTAVDPASGAVVRQLEPTRDFWRRLDALLITPLRTIIPQTSELGETVVAVICGRSDLEIVTGGQTQQEKLDVVRPLATCGGFIVFMLGLGCLYVYRQDF